MTLGRQLVGFLALLGLLLSPACKKNKPQLPAKIQAPTLTASVPDQIPDVEQPAEPPATQQHATVEESPPKKAPPKRHASKKPAQQAATNQGNTTVAVNRPPANPAADTAPDTAIAADVTMQQLTQQKQTTADLLDSTEKDLKGLNRDLSHDEENMVAQIKSYITQSRTATREGDFERAYNLATKAHLLADALVKK